MKEEERDWFIDRYLRFKAFWKKLGFVRPDGTWDDTLFAAIILPPLYLWFLFSYLELWELIF